MLYLIYCEGRVKIYFSIRNSHQCLEGDVWYYYRFCLLSLFWWPYSMFFIHFPESAGRQLCGYAFGLLPLCIIEKSFVRKSVSRFIVFCK